MKAQALIEMLSPFFKLDDDERDVLGKGGKSRVMGVTQWAGRKDSRGSLLRTAAHHPSQLPARGHPWALSRSLASPSPPETLTLAGPKPGPPPSTTPFVKTHSTHGVLLLTLLTPHSNHT